MGFQTVSCLPLQSRGRYCQTQVTVWLTGSSKLNVTLPPEISHMDTSCNFEFFAA